MPNSGIEKEKKKDNGQQRDVENNNNNQIVKMNEEIDLSDHSPQPESPDLTLIRSSLYYNPEMDLNLLDSTGGGVPVLTAQSKPIRATALKMTGPFTAGTEASIALKPTTSITETLIKMLVIFMNCI